MYVYWGCSEDVLSKCRCRKRAMWLKVSLCVRETTLEAAWLGRNTTPRVLSQVQISPLPIQKGM